jgi:hypothetical protein
MQAPELSISVDTAPSPDSTRSHHLPTRSEQKRQSIPLSRVLELQFNILNL